MSQMTPVTATMSTSATMTGSCRLSQRAATSSKNRWSLVRHRRRRHRHGHKSSNVSRMAASLPRRVTTNSVCPTRCLATSSCFNAPPVRIEPERVVEIGASPSIGSVGDSYDNALAETVNGYYKAELIYGPEQGPWKTVDEVELATLAWVHWHNTQRLHGYCGDIPPVEFEAAYAAPHTDQQLVGNQ